MKYYFRVKMLLVTFMLGLIGVYIFADPNECILDINIRQQIEVSVTPVVNVPAASQPEDTGGGGASGGITCDEARAEAKRKKKQFKDPNCE